MAESLPEELAEPLARAAPRLGAFGRQVLWYADVPSTNDLAAALAERGAAEGCVVAANAQSAGRGRQGRRWASPPGAGLYVSTILRPTPSVVPLLSLAAGLAIAEGIERATGLGLDLKWPNDVLAERRKVAGVLTEATSSAGVLLHVVLGFGINVMPAAYPPGIAGRATSLEEELGRGVDRGLLLGECLAALSGRYAELREDRRDAILDAWRARGASMMGRRVRWDADGRALCGVADGIDESGALVVRASGAVVRVAAGEVTWL